MAVPVLGAFTINRAFPTVDPIFMQVI